MSSIVLKLPDIKVAAESRARVCGYCQEGILQRYGGQIRWIRDPQVREVLVYRYWCCSCRRTFWHYPEGVDGAQQSQR